MVTAPGKLFQMNFFATLEENLFFFCDFDTRKLPAYIPAFYKECLDAWSNLKTSNVFSYEDVIDQIIWNNKNIVVDKQSLFEKHLFCQEIIQIGDLLSDMGKFLESSKVLTANLSPTQYFKLIGVVDVIPIAWRLIIKQSQEQINFSIHHSSEIKYILNWMKLYNKFKTKKPNSSLCSKQDEKQLKG